MKSLLKYLGKGIWVPAENKDITAGDKTLLVEKSKKRAPRSRSASSSEKLDSMFEDMKKSIEDNGYRSIKLGVLLRTFGFERKSAQRIEAIREALLKRGFHTLPKLNSNLDNDLTIKVYNYPVEQLGDFFDSEKELEKFVYDSGVWNKLNIKEVDRQFSPKGTKDRLDFKALDDDGILTVLELKNKGGGKTAVEQVLRYAGQLRRQFSDSVVRTILVTGIRNHETALAIDGMEPEQRATFEWYLYKYNKAANTLDFVRVNEDMI